MQVVHSDEPGIHVEFSVPEGDATILIARGIPNQAIDDFIARNTRTIEGIESEVRSFYHAHLNDEHLYATGRVVHLLGRPYALRFVPPQRRFLFAKRHANDATTVNLVDNLGTVEVFMNQAGGSDVRARMYREWADDYYKQKAQQAISRCMTNAQIPQAAMPHVEVRDNIESNAQLNRMMDAIYLSRKMEELPLICTTYVFIDAIAHVLVRTQDISGARESMMDRGCPEWRRAEVLLAEATR